MDAEKHIKEKERLNQALNGKLDSFVWDAKALLTEYNVDSMPGVGFDLCRYAIEELHMDRLNLPEW